MKKAESNKVPKAPKKEKKEVNKQNTSNNEAISFGEFMERIVRVPPESKILST